MNLITGADVTASALAAENTRLDIVAQNLANAQTTRTPDGGPYQRKIVSFETELMRAGDGASVDGVKVASITADPSPGERIYNPQHPDADAQGMVTMPNVNVAFEMVDLISASRAYEANLAVVKNARQMAMKTLQIGK